MDLSTLDIRQLAQKFRDKDPEVCLALERVQDAFNLLNHRLGNVVNVTSRGVVELDLSHIKPNTGAVVITQGTTTTTINNSLVSGSIVSLLAVNGTYETWVYPRGIKSINGKFTMDLSAQGISADYNSGAFYANIGVDATTSGIILAAGGVTKFSADVTSGLLTFTGNINCSGVFQVDNVDGITGTRTVKDGAGANKNVTVSGGIITAWET